MDQNCTRNVVFQGALAGCPECYKPTSRMCFLSGLSLERESYDLTGRLPMQSLSFFVFFM
jgi:hypothetical protein